MTSFLRVQMQLKRTVRVYMYIYVYIYLYRYDLLPTWAVLEAWGLQRKCSSVRVGYSAVAPTYFELARNL
jgi:hypothetical protein